MNNNFIVRPFIDSDSHIEEHVGVFDFLEKRYQHRRPAIIDINNLVQHRPSRNKVWLIDGEIRPKLFGYNPSCYATPPTSEYAKQKPVSTTVQGLLNVDEYLACMDTINLDVAVIYTTLFLHPVTADYEFEAALMRSYNTYMAERCGLASSRLKWGALIPMNSPLAAKAEVTRAKSLGASSIMILPMARDTLLHNNRFNIVFEEIAKQMMPVAVHVGWGNQSINNSCDSIAASLILNFEMSMMFGLFSFLAGGILDKFPDLKVGFLEAGAVWLPTILNRLEKWKPTPTAEVWPAKKSPRDYLRNHAIYFTIEGDEENLIEFVDLVGIDRILGSADFPHVHYAGGKLGGTFASIKNHTHLTYNQKQQFLGKNAQIFYGID